MRYKAVFIVILALLAGCQSSGIVEYWNENAIDYSDVEAAQDRFAKFAELAVVADQDDAEASLDALFDKLKEDEVAYYLYTDWMGSAFYNPLSPCRNPDLYSKVVDRIVSDGILSEGESLRHIQRRGWSQINKPGSSAVVPRITLDGRRTLVLVVDLGCPSCLEVLQELAVDPDWEELRRVAVCCGFGPEPEVEGWEYVFLDEPSEYYDPELIPVYYVVSKNSIVELSYTFAN